MRRNAGNDCPIEPSRKQATVETGWEVTNHSTQIMQIIVQARHSAKEPGAYSPEMNTLLKHVK